MFRECTLSRSLDVAGCRAIKMWAVANLADAIVQIDGEYRVTRGYLRYKKRRFPRTGLNGVLNSASSIDVLRDGSQNVSTNRSLAMPITWQCCDYVNKLVYF